MRAGIYHVAISVATKNDVDEFYRLLRQKHVRILYPPQEYPRYGRGYYSVFFLDPDGIST
jgi:catechol 2,3-dioxygenase-like lactoylglutathione lyase family enzyme